MNLFKIGYIYLTTSDQTDQLVYFWPKLESYSLEQQVNTLQDDTIHRI